MLAFRRSAESFFSFSFFALCFFSMDYLLFSSLQDFFFFNNWVSFHDLNKGPFCFRLENTDRVEQAEAMTVPLCFTYRRWPSCDPTYLQEHVSYSLITCISLERFLSRLLYYSFFFFACFLFLKTQLSINTGVPHSLFCCCCCRCCCWCWWWYSCFVFVSHAWKKQNE